VSFRLGDYADALAGFIAALGLERPHILGHSFGGALLLELYRRHPAVPATLILVASTAGWAGSLPRAEIERRLRFALEVADRLPGEFEPTSMRGVFSKVMSPKTVDGLVAIMSEIRPVATRAMAHALAEADLRDVLTTIAVPTLLVYGEADERTPLSVAEELGDDIPGSRLVVMPGLGHECYLEAPEGFNAELRRFLRSVA